MCNTSIHYPPTAAVDNIFSSERRRKNLFLIITMTICCLFNLLTLRMTAMRNKIHSLGYCRNIYELYVPSSLLGNCYSISTEIMSDFALLAAKCLFDICVSLKCRLSSETETNVFNDGLDHVFCLRN